QSGELAMPLGHSPPRRRCWLRALRRRLPVLGWLPRYSPGWLQLDLIAGVTVGITVVPQALAYAEVAGLPPQYGLYSSFVGCFVYCFLGTAKDVTLGPTAIMSLLVSSYAFHDPVYAVLLAFLTGCIQLAMGLLHLGFLLDFISCPVIKGFTSAASITISFNQVKNILGLHGIPRQFFLQVYETLRRIGETRPGDAILGLTCLAALAGLRAMKSRLPPTSHTEPLATRASYLIVWTCATARNALVVLFAGLVAYCFQLRGSQPLTLTGSIPQGLPPCRLPPFSKAEPNGTVPFGTMVEVGARLAGRCWPPQGCFLGAQHPCKYPSALGKGQPLHLRWPRRGLRCGSCPAAAALAVLPSRTWESGWLWSRSWAWWRPLRLPRRSVQLLQFCWREGGGGGRGGGGLGASLFPWGQRWRGAGGSLRRTWPGFGQELSAVPGCCTLGCQDGAPFLPPVLPPLRVHGGLSLQEARGDAAPLLPASQNDYRIDPNQELLAMGKRPLGAAGQGVGIRPQHRGVLQPFLLGAAEQPWELSPLPISHVGWRWQR
uniref:Solute carrier family 26 member 11 n=1 Tax=Anas platyrhynchos platyrhynchos TaxID=8840 RepID=A0A493SVG8_ANAPP